MAKGQSFLVEFILFFTISFGLFATISYIFYNQNLYLNERTGNSLLTLVNDVVLTDVIKSVECKSCDSIKIEETVPSKVGGFFYQTNLTQTGVRTGLFSVMPINSYLASFNLNTTYSFSGESKSENKKIEVLINNIGLTIGVE